jgi:hypothetical protein
MTRTAMIVTAGVITLGIYDLAVVAFGGGVEMSVSRFMQDAGLQAPWIVFTIGFICGHIFGYMPPREKQGEK